ncbi:MAG: 50S ribosomal protein L25 [Melioribacteraceae bacterium]|nr:50S ribosomal protein L25 [Melioribacteraceae bacterium]MCF8264040.1 50S ribosomal protein L25 [Melioribacteraceae bacterium]MCF8411852.1 50S ribosomal protein L25 [Melioribacteraceae bacterium]
MSDTKLEAKKREPMTKGNLNTLRKEGFVPGVFYSGGNEPTVITVPKNKINPFVFTSSSNIIGLSVDGGEENRCIIKDVQFHPVTDEVMHFDLYGLTAGQELQMEIPVLITGSKPEGVQEGGILTIGAHRLEVSCLPKNIPDHLEVDASALKMGDSIFVKDLNFENIKIVSSEETMVVAIQAPRLEEEVATEEVDELGIGEEPEGPEVIGKGKTDSESE